MKLFTIAAKEPQHYGHGAMGYAEIIRRVGLYDSGEFPPLFKTKRRAEKYLASTELLAFTNKVVVELTLED